MRGKSGVALLLTLWVLAALIALAVGLSVMARTETQIARNHNDALLCRWAAKSGGNCAVSQLGSLTQNTYWGEEDRIIASETEGIDIGDAAFETVIEDEAGKVNINTAPVEVLEALFGGREIAERIIDWRDSDDNPQPMGAENEYYGSLEEPYRCKNAPFDTVGELRLVKDVTEELLAASVSEDGKPLKDLLTVYSRDKNETVDGKPRINIKTATEEQLKSELGDVLTDRNIRRIIDQRSRGKYQTAGQLALENGFGRGKIRRIFDRITVSDAKTLPGLINVNTASLDVLAALPGMERFMAEAIIAQRVESGAFADVGRVFQVRAVTPQAFAKWADMLTVRSQAFKIMSIGRMTTSRASSRITYVVDVSDPRSAKIRYWQE